MCPFNLFFHGVACELVKTELTALGFRSTFVPLGVDIPDQAKTWDGVTRKYWQRDTYYLPICVYLP
jgi:protein arginine N-methyltransferase 2